MSDAISVSEARAVLAELVARVLDGEEITLTRHGQPVAVLVRPDTLRNRRSAETFAAADTLRTRLAAAAERPVPAPGLSRAQADRRVRDLRGERDAQSPQ